MKRISILVLINISITLNVLSQECNCAETFNWIVNIFEKNDAGFQYVIDKKGKDDYQNFTDKIKEKSNAITSINDCSDLMLSWLHYFRPGHVYISPKETPNSNNNSGPSISENEIRNKYKNEKTINLTEKQLIASLEKKQNKNPIEGIWTNGTYTIGIIGNEKSTKVFTGFIIKADSIYWVPKQIKAEFTLNDDNKTFTVNFLMRDHSKQLTKAFFVSNTFNLLNIIDTYYQRVYPKNELSVKEEMLITFAKSKKPYIKKISDKTIYLRIPSFEYSEKPFIDSVLAENDKLLTTTPNLIIDIRNGTGGSDNSYHNIIPYLYTNPIRYVNMQLYATEQNAKGYEEYSIMLKDDTTSSNYCKRVSEKMKSNIGKFITTSENISQLDTLSKVFPFPKKVAIICNKNNGSTDEQFLFVAKQSQKVKIFGIPTGGMLDISNMNMIDSPDGKFTLGYCMSKSFRIPKFCIDGVGIQPDYFLDDGITETDWIDYTKTILEQ